MSETEALAVSLFERVPDFVNADEWLIHRGRYLTTECMIEIGAVPFYLSIAAGRIVSVDRGPRLMRRWTFAIRGTARAWVKFWQQVPEPGWHDIFALAKRNEAAIEGDIRPLMTHLQYFKDLLATPRRVIAEQ